MMKPILFNAEMVRALLDGRKTQTRRVVKKQPDEEGLAFHRVLKEWHDTSGNKYTCPYGQVGDRLWVKESYWIGNYDTENLTVSGMYNEGNKAFGDVKLSADEFHKFQSRAFPFRSSPSIFMYKSLSRINLEIVDIRIERVQDITKEEALAEGLRKWPHKNDYAYGFNDGAVDGYGSPTGAFHALWDSIYKNWSDNPWVWVVEFKRC
jgi:hypothetical protein